MTFNPERFADGVAKACTHPLAFMPSSYGPRHCIGQNLAPMVAQIVVGIQCSNGFKSLFLPLTNTILSALRTVAWSVRNFGCRETTCWILCSCPNRQSPPINTDEDLLHFTGGSHWWPHYLPSIYCHILMEKNSALQAERFRGFSCMIGCKYNNKKSKWLRDTRGEDRPCRQQNGAGPRPLLYVLSNAKPSFTFEWICMRWKLM